MSVRTRRRAEARTHREEVRVGICSARRLGRERRWARRARTVEARARVARLPRAGARAGASWVGRETARALIRRVGVVPSPPPLGVRSRSIRSRCCPRDLRGADRPKPCSTGLSPQTHRRQRQRGMDIRGTPGRPQPIKRTVGFAIAGDEAGDDGSAADGAHGNATGAIGDDAQGALGVGSPSPVYITPHFDGSHPAGSSLESGGAQSVDGTRGVRARPPLRPQTPPTVPVDARKPFQTRPNKPSPRSRPAR